MTRYTHACVRLERNGGVLVIDPGIFSEREALDGAGAVLVTHEHPDHMDADALRAACAADPGLRIFTNPELAAKLADLPVTAVGPDQDFTAAGFGVRAFGGRHAEVYGGKPDLANLGFVVEGELCHPGDSYALPDTPVRTLLIPVAGPWVTIAGAIDHVRAVKPDLAVPIHDAVLSDAGLGLADGWVGNEGGAEYRRLAPGESVDL
jgi:L-ascorbate metabolism protein UlaG (beta-lactamase superfamily)